MMYKFARESLLPGGIHAALIKPVSVSDLLPAVAVFRATERE